MTQRSGIFVVYRLTDPDRTAEYLKQIAHRIGREDVATTNLDHAVKLDKKNAFKTAIEQGERWSVGELIADANGVKVER